MQMQLRIAVFALSLVAFPAIAEIKERPLSPVTYAAPGDSATGEVISEDESQLQLNVRPCNGARTVMVFHKPYLKDPAGTMQCPGGAKSIIQVIQK